MKKLKIFNYRPMFAILVFLFLVILIANYFYTNYYFFVLFLSVSIFSLAFFSLYYKSMRIFLICLISLIVGILGLNFEKYRFDKEINISTNSVISGKIEKFTGISRPNIILSNVSVDGKEIDGKMAIKVNNFDSYDNDCIGFELCCVVESVEHNNFFNDEMEIVNAYVTTNNVKYSVTTSAIEIAKNKKSLKENLLSRFRNNLDLGLNNENTELMYSMLFGDTTDLNYKVKTIYSDSGIYHLLAVSGMNVVLIISCLEFILNIFKTKKYLKAIIIVFFVITYCYLCSWTVSVVRASIMAIVLLLSALAFQEYDALSSLSFAGTLILVATPSSAFDPSFLLSFCCVFGLIMLYPLFKNLLKKLKLHNFITDSLSLSITTIISTFCITLLFFEEVNFASLIANTLLLSMFGWAFLITFFVSLFSLLLPFLSYSLIVVDILVSFLTLCASIVARLKTNFDVLKIDYFVTVVYFASLFFISKFNIMQNKKLKIILFSSFIVVITLYISYTNNIIQLRF